MAEDAGDIGPVADPDARVSPAGRDVARRMLEAVAAGLGRVVPLGLERRFGRRSAERVTGPQAALARERRAAGDDAGAIRHFRRAIAEEAVAAPAVFIELANLLLEDDRLAEADAAFEQLVQRWPENAEGHLGRARILLLRHEWPRATEVLAALVSRFPDAPFARIGLAEALRMMGRCDESEALLREAAAIWPDAVAPWVGLARVAAERRDFALARDRWRDAARRFPDDLTARGNYVRSLLDTVSLDEAWEVFNAIPESEQTPEYRCIRGSIHAAAHDWDAALRVMREVCLAAPGNLALGVKEVTLALQRALFSGSAVDLAEAAARAESLRDRFPYSRRVAIALVKCLVAAGRDADAARGIDALGDDSGRDEEVMRLRAWRAARAGDVATAKGIWTAIQDAHTIPAVHGPPGAFDRLDRRPLEAAPGEVLLFTVIRNEAWRLPRFLEYYRRLGVDRFYVVDNGSTDAGTEILLAQADVHVFRTDESYARANSGMRWVNALVDRHGGDHWCLYVDVDELLVFPGVEALGLRHLLRYLERKGHEACFAFMLDMHGPSAKYRPDHRPGDDLLPLYPWFANTYRFVGAVDCPYRHVSGGIQRRFQHTWNLTKTPIIRGGRSIRFLSSSHVVTPANVSDVTGALLHFKLAGNVDQWGHGDIGDRRPGCVLRHLSYARVVNAAEADVGFIDSTSVRYESSRQLVDLGLLQCPADFLHGHGPGEDGR